MSGIFHPHMYYGKGRITERDRIVVPRCIASEVIAEEHSFTHLLGMHKNYHNIARVYTISGYKTFSKEWEELIAHAVLSCKTCMKEQHKLSTLPTPLKKFCTH